MAVYDVFLSHASTDKPAVEALARRLREDGIEPFLDDWHLVPGEPWQEGLEKALEASRTCAVFVGEKLGPWQNEEMRDALDERVRESGFRVIPVLLPGAVQPGQKSLPRFLRRLLWVDFSNGLDDEDAYYRLLCGIRGVAPDARNSLLRRNAASEPARRVRTPLRWLHLSDFHFQAPERWDRRATLNALLRYARQLKDEDRRPDFVFVTGDVAFSGKKAEYEQAERFFRQLAEDLELDPRERFFFVPGNHDVDQSVLGAAERYIVSNLKDQNGIEEIFDDKDAMALLGRRLETFYAFTERLLGTARGWRRERPWRVDVRKAGGVDVGVLQLNSAWTSGPADDKDLLVGEAQVREALEQTADAFLRIALVHHPPVELREFDRDKLTPLLAASGVHFLLRGHLHSNRVEATVSPEGFLVELAAGTVYTGGNWPRAFLESEVDLAEGKAHVCFLGYSDKGQGFWNRDSLAYEKAPDGVWTLELPDHLKLEAEAPPTAEGPLTAARQSTLTSRYRSAAAAVHGTVRFVGIAADHRQRPNVQVPELFVPLRLEVSGRVPGEKTTSWSTSDLLRHLLAPQEKGGDRPGSRAGSAFSMALAVGRGPTRPRRRDALFDSQCRVGRGVGGPGGRNGDR